MTKPYTPAQVAHLQEVGVAVDKILDDLGLDLTMGGEPTFVSIDDMTSPQWTVAADGPEKRRLANDLAVRLFADFAPGGLIQRSQGKWYPGEPLPRWQIGLIWRTDGEPLWTDPTLLADPFDDTAADDPAAEQRASEAAERIARLVTARFGLPDESLQACFEDPFAALAGEVGKPEGAPPSAEDDPVAGDPTLVSALDADLSIPAAWALPLTPAWWGNGWASARWRFRRGRLVLLPGDSPAGARMPLSSVNWKDPEFEGEEDYTRSGAELTAGIPEAVVVDPDETPSRTALVVQARDGIVHLYLPPLEKLEKFAELIGLLDEVVREVGVPVVFEGYGPPPDARARVLMVTPDPGVIEVNVHPTSSWTEFSDLTANLYETARQCRLGTETFGLDGRHSGTGGGNHITLGGSEPAKSPLLQRPDLLVSMLTYWQHHPSLSYLFSGRFVGPTSQAPRVDEGRPETLYELEIAFSEVERLVDGPDDAWDHRPWAVDRALRHLLTDITGNTHRAEFCIDKMYSPDSSRGRLGLLELRGFEMPPHPDMALVQALLVRSILARSALEPYRAPLIRWGTRLHERFLLPHFVATDLADVVADLRRHQIDIDLAWFDPYLEFRFPRIGISQIGDATLELRSAIEPWHVLGEESSSGGTARYVDSSVERVQVLVTGFDTGRYAVTCNGRPVPLHSTGAPGSYVAG
ncbi:MAG TPA: transglutaminase family protein, partial [Microlunatus sp.]|nr:transglutaminase family protein [Microlunatus sp.]